MAGRKPAKLANRKGAKEQKFVTVKVREMYLKPSGHYGVRTRWETRAKEGGLDAALGR